MTVALSSVGLSAVGLYTTDWKSIEPQPEPGAIYFSDAFDTTVSPHELISTYTGGGNKWVYCAGTVQPIVWASLWGSTGVLASGGDSWAVARADVQIPSANVSIAAQFAWNNDYAQSLVTVASRLSANGQNTYHGGFDFNTMRWTIYRRIGGQSVVLAESKAISANSIANGAIVSVELAVSGSNPVNLRLKSDGITVASVADSSADRITAAGYIGVVLAGYAGPGITAMTAGEIPIEGAASEQIAQISSVASGTVEVAGDASADLSPMSSVSSGTVEVFGHADAQISPISSVSGGTVEVAGNASADLSSMSSVSSATVEASGQAAAQLSQITATGRGVGTVDGQAAAALGPVTSNADGVVRTTLPDRPADAVVRVEARQVVVRVEPRVVRVRYSWSGGEPNVGRY